MGIHGGDSCKPEVRPGTREESASPAWLAAPVTSYQLPARRWPKNQPAENSNGQRSPPKTTITTRLRTDLGRQWTPVLTATKIKERHYNNVLSFPTLFQQEHRERRRQLETNDDNRRPATIPTMDTTIRRVVPVGPRRRGEPEADNKATPKPINPNQTRRKYSCLKCHCQNFYKIKEKKGPTHSPRPASPHKHILHPKFYTQNTHKYTKTFQHSPPPTRNNPTPSDRQTFTKPYRQ